MDRVETFRLLALRPEVESACRRALRNADWQELPTNTFKFVSPAYAGNSVLGELLMWLLESIPPSRRYLTRLRTHTWTAPTPSPDAHAVVYGVWRGFWRGVVMVTISLRDREGSGTEVTIAGKGGLPGAAAAAVRDLRHSIEIESGSVNPPRPSQP